MPGHHKVAHISTESGESVSCLGSTVCLCLQEQAPHVRTGGLPMDMLLCDQTVQVRKIYLNFFGKIGPYDPMFSE